MKISTTNIILIVLIMAVTRKKCSNHFEDSLPTNQLQPVLLRAPYQFTTTTTATTTPTTTTTTLATYINRVN